MATYAISGTPSSVVSQLVSTEAQPAVIAALKQVHGATNQTVAFIDPGTTTQRVFGNTNLVVDNVGGTLNLIGMHINHVTAMGDLDTTVNVSGTGNIVVAGAGKDVLTSFNGNNKLIAGSGADTLRSGNGHDTLVAGGNSQLFGGSASSVLEGGLVSGAHDTLFGGTGGDNMSFLQGNNFAFGGTGEDTIRGGSGHDQLVGGGKSLLYAGSGGSTLIGGVATGAHDTLYGGTGADSLSVTQGNNLLIAGTGADTLQGGSGHDTLYGGGHSLLIAGPNGSKLVASALKGGSDTLQGGAGDDKFVVKAAAYSHEVVSGGGGQDVLHLQGLNFHNASFTQDTVGGVATTTISFANHQTITVSGVSSVFGDNGTKIDPAHPPVIK